MRRHSIVLALLLAAGLGGPPARAGDATGAFAPYEDLLEVLGDLTWHLRDDLYRFPPPKDPTGHDLYRLALSRLENWEKRYPGRLRDVVGYARAEALERLGEYAKAAAGYGQVAAERALRFLIQKHADSRSLPDHILRLGDLYAEVARDYVEQHERPLAFEEDEFVQRADRALEMYRKVATWDGAREKPEAQGRFAAFDAYKTSVLSRYR